MSFLTDYIQERFRHNQNFLCVITGKTGSGKSEAGLKICEDNDPTFNEERIIFKMREFMNYLNSNKCQPYQFFLLDELGATVPKREWYKISNRVFTYVMQTFRDKNLGVVMTVPTLGFVDKNVEPLLHFYIQTLHIRRDVNQCITKAFIVDPNPKTGKVYYKYPRVTKNKMIRVMKRTVFKRPSLKLRKLYIKKRKIFTRELGEDAIRKIDVVDKKIKKEPKVLDLDAISKEIYSKYPKNKVTIPFIRSLYTNISHHNAAVIRLKVLALKHPTQK